MTRIQKRMRINRLRSAFIMSIFSLILCVTMLIGSTFAWFTDTATTAPVRITAGNLDIDLLKWNNTEEGGEYVSVSDPDTKIFDPDFLWEPGATQIVYLAVENKGSLAAKFNVLLTVNDGGLAEALEYKLIENKKQDEVEGDSWSDLKGSSKSLEIDRNIILKGDGILQKYNKEAVNNPAFYYFVLAIHMKPGASNVFMRKWIRFDLSVNAVQTTEESDSFGNQYDAGLALPKPHTYYMRRSQSEQQRMQNSDQWNLIAKYVVNNGDVQGNVDPKSEVKHVVFGKYSDNANKLNGKTFTDGKDLGSEASMDTQSAEDVKGFFENSTLYVLTNDAMGTIRAPKNLGSSLKGFFYGWTALESVDLSALDTVDTDNMANLFRGCSNLETIILGNSFITSKVTDMRDMFFGCTKLKSIDLTAFSTAKVTRMDDMFNSCAALTSLDLTSFNTELVTNMNNLFKGCSNLTKIELTPSTFNTGKIKSMTSFFNGCAALVEIDLSGFNTENVTTMKNMFFGCESLTTLDLSSFNTSSVTDMTGMFRGCKGLTKINLSSFNVSKVTNMNGMFHTCSKLIELDLTSFITKDSHDTDITGMFRNCSKLEKIFATDGFDVSAKIDEPFQNVFYGCTSLNKDKIGTDEEVEYIRPYGANHKDSSYARCGQKFQGAVLLGYFRKIGQ